MSPGSRGSSPRSSPRTRSPGCCASRERQSSTSCASPGRGDKDLAEVLARAGRGRERRRSGSPARTHRRGVRARGKRAALMPYLMGGFPDLDASRAIGEAYADGGADLVELGVPFSDPLADGPGHPGRRHARRCAPGATVDGVLDGARRSPRGVPVVAHVLREPRAGARRRSASPPTLAARGRQRADRPRPAARGGAGGRSRRATRPGSRSCRWSRRRRPTSAWRASASGRAASSTPCRSPARRASARALADRRGRRRPREGPHDVPVALGFGIAHARAGRRGGGARAPTA